MTLYRLDVAELYRHLDAKRTARRWLWKDVAQELGLSASTLSRLAAGKRPDADALVTLLAWLDIDVSYVVVPDSKKKVSV